MKNYTYGFVTSLILIAVFAFSSKTNNVNTDKNKAQDVPLIVKERKPHEFYVVQAKLWKEVVANEKTNENAWFNLFKANRFAKLTYNSIHSPEISWQKNTEWINEADHLIKGDDIIQQIEKNIPKTFMAYYLKFYNSENIGNKDFHLLEKAYDINPDFYEIYDDFVAHYEITNNREKRKQFNEKWFKSNDFSETLLNYEYNVLMTLKENSVLFSRGDNDFFPVLMLQDALGIREDVTVVNIPLMVSEIEYRNSIFEKLNVEPFNEKYVDGWSEKNMKEMIDHILTEKPKELPVYFALGMGNSLKKDFEDKLYLVGLALEYSEKNIDNLAELKNNFNNKYLLDYIKIQFSNDSYEASVNGNYLHGITLLYDHYKLSGDLTKMIEMRELALTIANDIEAEHLKEYKAYVIHHFTK